MPVQWSAAASVHITLVHIQFCIIILYMITVDYSIQATKKLLGDQAKAMAKTSKKGEAQVKCNTDVFCFS